MNYCTTTGHTGNTVLLNQIQKQCSKVFWSIFYCDKFSKVDDVCRNYGILQVNDLFKVHVAFLCLNMSIIGCLLALKMFFLKLAM